MSEELDKIIGSVKGIPKGLGDVSMDLKFLEELSSKDGAKLTKDIPIAGGVGYTHEVEHDGVVYRFKSKEPYNGEKPPES